MYRTRNKNIRSSPNNKDSWSARKLKRNRIEKGKFSNIKRKWKYKLNLKAKESSWKNYKKQNKRQYNIKKGVMSLRSLKKKQIEKEKYKKLKKLNKINAKLKIGLWRHFKECSMKKKKKLIKKNKQSWEEKSQIKLKKLREKKLLNIEILLNNNKKIKNFLMIAFLTIPLKNRWEELSMGQ